MSYSRPERSFHLSTSVNHPDAPGHKSWFHILLPLWVGVALVASNGVLGDPQKYPLGDIPLSPDVYRKHLRILPADRMAVLEATLPAAYNARDENIVTVAKNQGSCGSCWAFATVGAMESHLLKTFSVGPEDLSEQQQVSCNTSMAGCSGGSMTAVRYWEPPPGSDKGPMHEYAFPYTANDGTVCSEPLAEQMGYRVANYYTVPQTTEGFKTSLYEDGPSYWRYNVYSDFYTYWSYNDPGTVYVNTGGTYQGGHAVLLIGWDDSKNAYLCKNSWGENAGPNGDGTFWIAYSGHANNLGFGMSNFDVVATGCSSDAECDDGLYCNGVETCENQTCQAGTPVACPDDGLFCNGIESCDNVEQACVSENPPCGAGYECDEANDICVLPSCGNGTCDAGEDCFSCPDDCISGPSSGTEEACFKGVADGNCHPRKETAECVDCSPGYCCGDGVCGGAENSSSCEIDCGVEVCDNGIDDDGDGKVDCADSDCQSFPACANCGVKKAPCILGGDCCSGRCSVKGVCL